MKKSRFTAEQIVSILNEAARKETKVAEICRKHGITEQTYYRWRRAYGGLQVSEAKRLRTLEDDESSAEEAGGGPGAQHRDAQGIRISMDGRGCWRDNIFVERLWRSLTYEEVYLHGYESVSAATTGISRYFTLYNGRRPHSSPTDRTPDDVFFSSWSLTAAA